MKNFSQVLLVALALMLFSNVSAQSSYNKEAQKKWKEVLSQDGYRLIDEWGEYVGTTNNALPTELRYYSTSKTYAFVGIVDDCSSCPISLKVAYPGEVPAEVPNVEAQIKRDPSSKVAILFYKNKFPQYGQAYYLLNNNSNSSKYMYLMLFEKSN